LLQIAVILNQSFQVVHKEAPAEDPFLDLDNDQDQSVRDEEAQGLLTSYTWTIRGQ